VSPNVRLALFGGLALLVLALLAMLFAWSWQLLARHAALGRPVLALKRWMRGRDIVDAGRGRYPRLWRFVAGRFSSATMFGLHLTLGLAVTVVALLAFAKIADDVSEQDDLAHLDALVAGVVSAHRTPALATTCSAVSVIGAPVTVGAVTVLVGLLLAARRRWWLASVWVATVAGGGLLNLLLKTAFRRERPPGAAAFLHGQSWSFPSGHVLGATVCFGMLAYLVVRRDGPVGARRVEVIAAAASLILLIGATRVCLGVHYTTDVFAALAAGAMWLAVCISGLGVASRRGSARVATQKAKGPAPLDAPESVCRRR
jgi:undecaprenyl-diphosphatase